MLHVVQEAVSENRNAMYTLLRRYFGCEHTILLQSDLHDGLKSLQTDTANKQDGGTDASALTRFILQAQEGLFRSPWAYFCVRPGVASMEYLRIHGETLVPETLSASEFLQFKEMLAENREEAASSVLEVDFAPFGRDIPHLADARSIGQGMLFLNRQLSSAMFTDRRAWADKMLHFLTLHAIEGQQLMIHEGAFSDVDSFGRALQQAIDLVEKKSSETPWADFAAELLRMGFQPGWGDTAGQTAESMNLLADVLTVAKAGGVAPEDAIRMLGVHQRQGDEGAAITVPGGQQRQTGQLRRALAVGQYRSLAAGFQTNF